MTGYNDDIATGLVGDATDIKAIFVPIGGIISWAKTLTGVPALPNSYLECDGAVISDADSPLNGETLPNLNGATDATKKFLRGNTTSGSTGGSATHGHSSGTGSSTIAFDTYGTTQEVATSAHTHTISTESNLPVCYEVVFIMRIK